MNDNSPKIVTLRAPISIVKFMEPRNLSRIDFFTLWNNQKFAHNEVVKIVKLRKGLESSLLHVARYISLGGHFHVLRGIDSSNEIFVTAAAFPPSGADPNMALSIVLCRTEVGTGTYSGMLRVTVRSDSSVLGFAVSSLMTLIFGLMAQSSWSGVA
eukprot:Trichotokara_eunicae@DN4419_c0_g1_i1.p1